MRNFILTITLAIAAILLATLSYHAQGPGGGTLPSGGGSSFGTPPTTYAVGGGTAQAQTVAPSTAITNANLTGGVSICWVPIAPNSGPGTTLAGSGTSTFSAHTIVKPPSQLALIQNDIITTQVACVVYNGVTTNFELQNPQAGIGALKNIINYGPAAQGLNLYVAGGCTNGPPPICTGNYEGFLAQPSLTASLQWLLPPFDGGVMTSDNAQHLSFSGDSGHSVTIAIGSTADKAVTQLCSTANCPAGTYAVTVYVDMTTPCGTSGTFIPWLAYTDDSGARNGSSVTTFFPINGVGSAPATGTLTTTATANWGQATYIVRTTGVANQALGSINYGWTRTACGSAGPMVGVMYLNAVRVGN